MKQNIDFDLSVLKESWLDDLKKELLENTKEYVVKKWDTVISIANEHWISDYRYLVSLNKLAWINMKFSWVRNNVINIRIWDVLRVPKDYQKLYETMDKMRTLIGVLTRNNKLDQHSYSNKIELSDLQIDVLWETYPWEVKSIWLWNSLNAIASVEEDYWSDIRSSRIIDVNRQSHADCASLLKWFIKYSMNLKDLTKEEIDFLNKKDMHAWILPTELMKIWYAQTHNLMDSFDQPSIWGIFPFKEDKYKEYTDKVGELWDYVSKQWIEWSFVPMYFAYSRYKWVVRSYNQNRKEDKHFNTHQVMLAKRDWKKKFYASEFWEIKGWKLVPFGADARTLDTDIKILKTRLDQEKSKIPQALIRQKKDQIKNKLDLKNNEYLTKRKKTLLLLMKRMTNDKSNDYDLNNLFSNEKFVEFSKLFLEWDFETIKKSQYYKWLVSSKNILNKEIDDRIRKDIAYVRSMFKMELSIQSDIDSLNSKLNDDTIKEINLDKYISRSSEIVQLVDDYNKSINSIIKLEEELAHKIESSKNPPQINIINYLIWFVQQRQDLVWYTKTFRDKIEQWIWLYSNLINISINGKTVNVWEEFNKYKSWEKSLLNISSTDNIEISWPLMLDWVHYYNSTDLDEVKNMNSRCRFFFELVVTQNLFPSEMLEPSKGVSFFKDDLWEDEFDGISNHLRIKAMYDIRRWESLESVLYRNIPIFEQTEFKWLSPDSQEYKDKIDHYYSLQIDALKMKWYLKSENILNKGAFNINRPLPYFDPTTIKTLHSRYISQRIKKHAEKSKDNIELSSFIEVSTYPWDTNIKFFNRIAGLVKQHIDVKPEFTNLKLVDNMSYFQRIEFISRLLDKSVKDDNFGNIQDFINWNISPFKTVVIKLQDIDTILQEIKKISYYDWAIDKKIRIIDNDIIDFITPFEQNRSMLRRILFVESYTPDNVKNEGWDNDSMFTRLELKRKLEKVENEEDFYGLLNKIPFLWKYLTVESVWDFQIRLYSLKRWWNEEWITKKQLIRALDFADKFFDSNDVDEWADIKKLQKDLDWVKLIRDILNQPTMSESDFDKIYMLLRHIIVLDDKSKPTSNYYGKIISASLINDKLNLHFDKLIWLTTAFWDDIGNIYWNPNKLKSIENLTMVTNNIWETKVKYAIFENYLLRVFWKFFDKQINTDSLLVTKGSIIDTDKWAEELKLFTDKVMEDAKNKFKRFVWADSTNDTSESDLTWFVDDSLWRAKSWFKWSISYDRKTFIDNLEKYYKQLAWFKFNDQDILILAKFRKFLDEIKSYSEYSNIDSILPRYQEFKKLKDDWEITEEQENEYKDFKNNKDILELRLEKKLSLAMFNFVKDSELKQIFESKDINTSIIPELPEFNSSPFHKSVFNYVNKLE